MVSRPENVVFEKTEDDLRAEHYSKQAAPGFWRRMLVPSYRITRTDFLIVLLVVIGLRFAPLVFRDPGAEVNWALISIYLAVPFYLLVVGAAKRCKDMDMNPWFGVVFLIFTPTILALLICSGTKGANRFGQDPGAKS
jgi:uncharacterized membrane protein YhaH (DUF805 family)